MSDRRLLHFRSPRTPVFFLVAPAVVASVLILATSSFGCASPTKVLRMSSRIDSLSLANRGLLEENKQLTDSLAFIDFVESGEFDRRMRTSRNRILQLEYQLEACRDGGAVVAAELVDELFEPASAKLTGDGRKRLDAIAEKLSADHGGALVRVHGHADTSKPGATLAKTYPTNWELSAARSAAVVRYLIDNHEFDPKRIAAVSFGDGLPRATNETRAGRKLNRRIEVVVM